MWTKTFRNSLGHRVSAQLLQTSRLRRICWFLSPLRTIMHQFGNCTSSRVTSYCFSQRLKEETEQKESWICGELGRKRVYCCRMQHGSGKDMFGKWKVIVIAPRILIWRRLKIQHSTVWQTVFWISSTSTTLKEARERRNRRPARSKGGRQWQM